MEKRLLIVLLCLAGALSSVFAADRQVQGVVISSEDNLPLIGASVYATAEDLKKQEVLRPRLGLSPTWTASFLFLFLPESPVCFAAIWAMMSRK